MSSVSKLRDIERREKQEVRARKEGERQQSELNEKRMAREHAERQTRERESLRQGLAIGKKSGVLSELEKMKRALPKSAVVNCGGGSFDLRFNHVNSLKEKNAYYDLVSVFVKPDGVINVNGIDCRNREEFTPALAKAVHSPEKVEPYSPPEINIS